MRSRSGTFSCVVVLLGLLLAGCHGKEPAAPEYVYSWASIDSLWLLSVDQSTVTLGVSGLLPG